MAQNRVRLLNRIIFGLALFGTLLTVHLWIQSERGFSRGCLGLSEPQEVGVVECVAVIQSDAGKLFGISNIVYGFFFFGTLATLSFLAILSKGETTAKLRKAGFAIVSIGVLYALYLFIYQVFVLGQFCQLCLTTGFTTAVLFGLHAVEWSGKSTPRFELAELVREVGLFLVMILIAGMLLVAEVFFVNQIGTLELTSANHSTESSTAQAPESRLPDESQSQAAGSQADNDSESVSAVADDGNDRELTEEEKARLDQVCQFDPTTPDIPNFAAITRGAPYEGPADADVALVEFFDPNCPHCKHLHSQTPEIMDKLGGRAKLYYRPFPIWPFSFPQVEALYEAQEQGKFLEMLQAQMDRQKRGGLSMAELTDIAGEIGMDTDQFRRDLNAGKFRTRVNRDRAEISQLGINSVPKIAIEGRFVASQSVTPACLDHMIESFELGG